MHAADFATYLGAKYLHAAHFPAYLGVKPLLPDWQSAAPGYLAEASHRRGGDSICERFSNVAQQQIQWIL